MLFHRYTKSMFNYRALPIFLYSSCHMKYIYFFQILKFSKFTLFILHEEDNFNIQTGFEQVQVCQGKKYFQIFHGLNVH